MGKTFVSIGAGAGIGLSTAERFAREGYDIVLAARNEARLQGLSQQFRTKVNSKIETIVLDASNDDDLRALAERFGSGTGVVHFNAAAMVKTDIFATTAEEFQHNLLVDIRGALSTVKYFAPLLEAAGEGTILLTGGAFGVEPNPEYLSLSIGKAGIRSMTKALFSQLAPKGIHVATLTVMNTISAGSREAEAAGESFWKLHREPREQWTWEAVLQ